MKRTILAVAMLTIISGCASVERFTKEHPVWTGVITTLVIGGVAASQNGGASQYPIAIGAEPSCHPQPDGSCR
jgi:uncharacterized protein YceK